MAFLNKAAAAACLPAFVAASPCASRALSRGVSSRMRCFAAAALVLSTLALRAGAQSTSIAGRVVAGDSGDPVPNARVTLTGASQDVAVHLTDADGHFTFSASSGPHRLVVSKPGYARAEVTMNRARATEISLHRGAVIAGRVVDEFGDAVIESRVSAEAVSSGSPNAATLASTVRGG
jgi:hypothetical protein